MTLSTRLSKLEIAAGVSPSEQVDLSHLSMDELDRLEKIMGRCFSKTGEFDVTELETDDLRFIAALPIAE